METGSYDHATARSSRRSRLRPLWSVVGRTRLRPRGKSKRLRPRCEAVVCRRIELRRGRLVWSWSYAVGCRCRTVGRGRMCSQAPERGRKVFRSHAKWSEIPGRVESGRRHLVTGRMTSRISCFSCESVVPTRGLVVLTWRAVVGHVHE